MSRSTRITILLAIDVLFFFVELIVGYSVGSLALVADSFHMLNDVMSLVVALYAIRLSSKSATDSRYSYGWHRAEILAALINGVFLLALCFSIFMEAIERFFSTPEISNPRLVVIVGSLGLASNILGLFLFHEHDHSHDDHKYSPVPSPSPSIKLSTNHEHGHAHASSARNIPPHHSSRQRSDSYSSLYGHPAATRASLMQAAQDIASGQTPTTSGHVRRNSSVTRSPVEHIGHSHHSRDNEHAAFPVEATPQEVDERSSLLDSTESQERRHYETTDVSPKSSGHSHSHSGSMNMRALVLHVLGDALGNVGVIATGLIIWLSSWSFKYYCDPVISLVITVIIFSSALPLVRSASFILLQGVPPTISLDEVRESILNVEGVLSLHELHIWQLSESKIVASVHVMASRAHDFMPIAAAIRKALHYHGIHSSTIQPEYHHTRNADSNAIPDDQLKTTADTSCLIVCPSDQHCDPSENACCPPTPPGV